MQLFDVLKDTNIISEIIEELRFEKYLKKIASYPDWRKKEIEERIYDREFAEENFSYLL